MRRLVCEDNWDDGVSSPRRRAIVAIAVGLLSSLIVLCWCGAAGAAGTTALRDSGSAFAGWSGGGCSGTATCTAARNAETPVTAVLAAFDAPVVASAPTADGHGYWLVTADGGVFAFGDAHYNGSLSGFPLNAPIMAFAPTADGHGYWLVTADGGVFAFGDARFNGSFTGRRLNAPIMAFAPTADGLGYWLAGANGAVFALGDAHYKGSLSRRQLNAPIMAFAPTADGLGYWLAAANGAVFALGDAPYEGGLAGQLSGTGLNGSVVLHLGRRLSVNGGGVQFTVGCRGQASCTGNATLSTRVGSQAGAARVARFSARHRTRVLVIGRQVFTVVRGRTVRVTIRLTRTGRRLLHQPGKLSARLTIVGTASGRWINLHKNLQLLQRPKKHATRR